MPTYVRTYKAASSRRRWRLDISGNNIEVRNAPAPFAYDVRKAEQVSNIHKPTIRVANVEGVAETWHGISARPWGLPAGTHDMQAVNASKELGHHTYVRR